MSPIFVVGLFALLGFISFATYRTSQLLRTWQPEENILLVPFENIARLGLIAVCVGLGLISGRGPAALGWIPTDPLGDVALGIVAGLAISIILLPPTLWVQRHHPEWHSNTVMRSIQPRNIQEWPWVVLALIPMALVEELLFRSLLLGGFAPYVNIIYFAIAVSILFGLLHLPQGEWGVLAVTLVGLALSALFLWRDSLLIVVVAHWVANVAQLVQATFLFPDSPAPPAED